MARANGDELFDFGDGANAAARADGGAIERGGGAGEFELARRGPILQKSVEEGGVENVAGAGCVRDVNLECGRVKKLRAVEGENAFVAERGGGEFVGEFFLDERERFLEIGFGGDAAGNVVAGDEEIDVGKKRVDAGVEIVEIGDDGNFCGASPFGGEGCGGGVVAVDQKGASGGDPFAAKFGGLEGEAFVVSAKDGEFACGVNEDEGLMAGAIRRGEEMRFNAGAIECGAMKLGGVVVAELSDVARAKAPGLASDHGAGNLAAGKNGGGIEFDFGAARGKFAERDESVGGVEAEAHDIDFRRLAHWKRVVSQRRRPQAARRIREMMERRIAGVQCAGIFGTRAIVAK